MTYVREYCIISNANTGMYYILSNTITIVLLNVEILFLASKLQ